VAETLQSQLAEAEARIAELKRRMVGATCEQAGHDWRSVGGKNAGCDDACICSVTVHECGRCGDSDYGDTAEADEVRAWCAEGRAHG
jgi:hypothetical protein